MNPIEKRSLDTTRASHVAGLATTLRIEQGRRVRLKDLAAGTAP